MVTVGIVCFYWRQASVQDSKRYTWEHDTPIGVKVQVIVDDSDDMDIRITDELEQSLGQSADLINEDTWIKLMSNFGHFVPSSKPHYYADVGKFVVNIPKPPEPRTVLF